MKRNVRLLVTGQYEFAKKKKIKKEIHSFCKYLKKVNKTLLTFKFIKKHENDKEPNKT